MLFHFVRVSRNAKIGPMPAVTAPRATCPASCALQGAGGCYAEGGHQRIHWDKVSNGTAKFLLSFEQLLHAIRALPRGIRWRYGTAGDLPPEPAQVLALADANQGREAIVYTHGRDFETYREAGRRGLHINLSADSPAEVDTLPADLSAVCVLPDDHSRHPSTTPGGRKIAPCPASFSSRISCATCNLCHRPRPGGVVIGFPAHGSRKRAVTRRLRG